MSRHKNRCLYHLKLSRNELSQLADFLSGCDAVPMGLDEFKERAITLNQYVLSVEDARRLWGQYSQMCGKGRPFEYDRAVLPMDDSAILEEIPEISG